MKFSAENFLARRGTLWAAGAFAVILFLATNLPWQLDDYDQAKQAFTSFEMIKEGHWLYQHTPHERVATKPPLVGWISAGIFAVTRSWDIAWRLPSIAAAIALAILLFRAGNVYSAAGGLIAMSAFAFNLLTPRLASLVRTDMPLALVVFLIGWLIWKKVREATPWERRDRWSIFALLTAAMLIKGPIVYAFLLPGLVIVQALRYRRADQSPITDHQSRSVWPGWWPWLASLSIFLLWAIAGSIFVPNFYDQVVLREFLGRFGGGVHRSQPLLFYVGQVFYRFAPWSVLLIGLAIVDLRARQWKLREALPKISPEVLWLICWSLGGLLVMSLIPSKRVDRIFPVLPPLCLLLAAQLGRDAALLRQPGSDRPVGATRRPYLAAAFLLSILCASGYSGFKVFTGYRDQRDALVKFSRSVREQAAANYWRYEIIKSSDEGLLLYLDKLHFVRTGSAVAEWDRGNIDALVVPAEKAPELARELRASVIQQTDARKKYILITR